MHDDRTILEAARRWLSEDPDPHTRAELESWIEGEQWSSLREAFGGRLQFGTAGLRGVLGPGPNRMNRALVRQVTSGLARYLLATQPAIRETGVVVGSDARRLSPELADDTARVLAGQGIPVHRFADYAPTPLVAFAVTRLGAGAGVVVTASHNPPEYNGYKVYWDNGAQIIPPHDEGISAAIDAVEGLHEVELPAVDALRAAGLWRPIEAQVEEDYLSALAGLLRRPGLSRELSVVYTPMHGVGARLVGEALRRSGLDRLHVVTEQAEPDGEFPTVRFPNPEEDGAMDLALALAREVDADLVLANDPDVDRLAAAIVDDGEWRLLSGNEIGTLLGHYLLTENLPEGLKPLVMTTIVSSRLLSKMAAALEAAYDETLTGFKWIANASQRHEREDGRRLVLGYEEALGYTVGMVTADKDGIGAALLMVELAAVCRDRGTDVAGYLEEIYRRFGFYRSRQHSVTLPGQEGRRQIESILAHFRAHPPEAVGDRAILSTVDYLPGHAGLPPSNVLAFQLEGDARILLRPSGTEPKIKYYFELSEPVGEAESIAAARGRADRALDTLEQDFLALTERAGGPA